MAVPMDEKRDLQLERVVDIAPELVWEAYTKPELLKQWFCPAPWSVSDCEIDLRPGGIFRTVMRSPEGEDVDGGAGCYLEVVPTSRLVWTSALQPGYRPAADQSFLFTAVIELVPEGSGTRYIATAIHGDEATYQQHAEMGFAEGWGKALDQLVALMKSP